VAGVGIRERLWLQDLAPGQARMRCHYKRKGKSILQYTVQLELLHEGVWKPIVRYDNAHGFCHRDTVHPDGSQEKTPIFIGTANDTFTWAIKEAQGNWEAHVKRFLEEVRP
jgi:hypothetical protein